MIPNLNPQQPPSPQAQPQAPSSGTLGFSGVRSEDLSPEDRLKIGIVGEIHSGKSWFAATAPSPVYIFDFDDRANSLAGKPGLIIQRKATYLQVEQTLSIAKGNAKQGKPNPKTWVFDSVYYMCLAMEDEAFKQIPNSYRKLKLGSTELRIRSGWDTVNAIQRGIPYIISEFSALGNVILVYHERDEKDPASTPEAPKFTGKITTDPQYVAKSLSLLDDVFRIQVDYKNHRTVKFVPDQEFNASTSLLLNPNKEYPPDFTVILGEHQSAKAAKNGSTNTPKA